MVKKLKVLDGLSGKSDDSNQGFYDLFISFKNVSSVTFNESKSRVTIFPGEYELCGQDAHNFWQSYVNFMTDKSIKDHICIRMKIP